LDIDGSDVARKDCFSGTPKSAREPRALRSVSIRNRVVHNVILGAMRSSKQLMKPPEPDAAFEISLRPPVFGEFTGQVKVCERLELMVAAAKKRGDVLEHILLSGPSGRTRRAAHES
jgi:hypothetical protein